MCGIAGLLGVPPELARTAAPRMLAAMRHRGPDDSGIEVVPDCRGQTFPAVLVHARLSILDLAPAGHQPMADRPTGLGCRPNWVAYNGEVFNFADLHDDLAQAGWPCHSRCDTEVILHAYRVWGETCVEKLRGMFAWCLLDAERGCAWFCRDRLGIKPLYLARPAAGGLLFASELRTLLAAGPELVPPRVNPSALESFLAQGAVCGLKSIVEGVELLAPGQSLFTDWAGKPQQCRIYWRVPLTPPRSPRPLHRGQGVLTLANTPPPARKLPPPAHPPPGVVLSPGSAPPAVARPSPP